MYIFFGGIDYVEITRAGATGLVCKEGQPRAAKDGGPRIPGDAGGLLDLFASCACHILKLLGFA